MESLPEGIEFDDVIRTRNIEMENNFFMERNNIDRVLYH